MKSITPLCLIPNRKIQQKITFSLQHSRISYNNVPWPSDSKCPRCSASTTGTPETSSRCAIARGHCTAILLFARGDHATTPVCHLGPRKQLCSFGTRPRFKLTIVRLCSVSSSLLLFTLLFRNVSAQLSVGDLMDGVDESHQCKSPTILCLTPSSIYSKFPMQIIT